jgi:hypothetical protein
MLKRVREAQRLVDAERNEPIRTLAARMGFTQGHFMKLLRLNYLAPDIVASLRDGTQPSHLTARGIIDANLPTDWPMQRKLFGFPEQPPMRTTENY